MTEENWDELKSRLPAHKPQSPPEGYFESLPDHIIERWKDEKQEKLPRRITLRKWIAIAAISTGVLLGGWWWLSHETTDMQEVYSSTEAYQYVIENIDEFSALMEDHIPNPVQDEIQLPEDSAVEEYLLDELEGHELEQIF